MAKREFSRNAGLAEFLLLSITLQIGQVWGDNEALPAAQVAKLQAGLLAPLKSWLANDRSFRDPNSIAAVVEAVRDTLP
jgi:hypothetical protein